MSPFHRYDQVLAASASEQILGDDLGAGHKKLCLLGSPGDIKYIQISYLNIFETVSQLFVGSTGCPYFCDSSHLKHFHAAKDSDPLLVDWDLTVRQGMRGSTNLHHLSKHI